MVDEEKFLQLEKLLKVFWHARELFISALPKDEQQTPSYDELSSVFDEVFNKKLPDSPAIKIDEKGKENVPFDCSDPDLQPIINIAHSTAKKQTKPRKQMLKEIDQFIQEPVVKFKKPIFCVDSVTASAASKVLDVSIDHSKLVTSTTKKASIKERTTPIAKQVIRAIESGGMPDKTVESVEQLDLPLDSSNLVTSTTKKPEIEARTAPETKKIIEIIEKEPQAKLEKLEPEYKQPEKVAITSKATLNEPAKAESKKEFKKVTSKNALTASKPQLSKDKRFEDVLERKKALLKEKQEQIKEKNRLKLEKVKQNREKNDEKKNEEKQKNVNFIGSTISKFKNILPSFGASRSGSPQPCDRRESGNLECFNKAFDLAEEEFEKYSKSRSTSKAFSSKNIESMIKKQNLVDNKEFLEMCSKKDTNDYKKFLESKDSKQQIIDRNENTMI